MATLLQLADGRFPAGGHAHSCGVEAAVATGAIHDPASLRAFALGRLHTVGGVDAAFAVAARRQPQARAVLDAELDARIVSPRLRSVSRSLGRQLLRAGGRVWPGPSLDKWKESVPSPHQALAFGAVGAAAGLDDFSVAVCVLHHLASTIAGAGLRLLALDPFDIAALLAQIAPTIDSLAADAVDAAAGDVAGLPSMGTPLTEILAEDHATWEVRLFAS